MTMNWKAGVHDSERVAALDRSGLVGTGPEDAFDRLVEFAAELTGADRCCITLLDDHCFTYKSTTGMAEGSARSGNVADSFCRYVVGVGRPLIVNDAHEDPRVLDNPAIDLYGVASWAGYPIHALDGSILGTFCMIGTTPHTWTEQEILILATMAQSVSSEIALRKVREELVEVRRELDELRGTRQSA